MIASADLKRDVLIVVCAISAGIHAALVPGHLAEGTGPGVGFAAAAVLLAALAVGLTLRPERRALVAGAGAVLAGLIASYVLATTTGLPLLHPEPEPVDGLALATKAIELVGLLVAGRLLWRGRPAVALFGLLRKGRTMLRTRTYRPIPLGLTMLIALFSALAALALTGGHDAAAHTTAADATMHASAAVPQKEFALRQDMRKLWEDHITWTRLAVISLTTDSPDTQATVGRLLQNQTDIGNAIKPFYGAAAGKQLTALLRQHILIAAARKGDQEAVGTEQARWTANADQIATLLSKANPRSWKLGAMKAMMHEHLRLTTDEVVARLQQDWPADVRAYDRIHVQILHMADMLSDGLVKQFPARFR